MEPGIVVTGMGWVTPLGNNLEEVWKNICEKKTAARTWEDLDEQGFRSTNACRVTGVEGDSRIRGREMAVAAVRSAVVQAGLGLDGKRTGIFVGSTMGESYAFEKIAEGEKFSAQEFTCYSFAEGIRNELGTEGICRAYGTACAAGNYAIHAGAVKIRSGMIDVAVVGGVDPFSRIAMAGFSRSRAMAADGLCRPFDRNRTGMILGEGAAFLILENEEEAIKRNIKPLAVIGAMGLTCDAFHPTSPDPGGRMMEKAMELALCHQKIVPEEVGWICAHGSGTRISDQTEARAIKNVFMGVGVPVSGFKGGFGHSLGAATAIEAVIAVLSLIKGKIPPTINFEVADDEMDIAVLDQVKYISGNWVLNCGYAFGGLNSALLIGKWK
jgi:3-oxoacyl-[acyl-carrier-protein] synthase II